MCSFSFDSVSSFNIVIIFFCTYIIFQVNGTAVSGNRTVLNQTYYLTFVIVISYRTIYTCHISKSISTFMHAKFFKTYETQSIPAFALLIH